MVPLRATFTYFWPGPQAHPTKRQDYQLTNISQREPVKRPEDSKFDASFVSGSYAMSPEVFQVFVPKTLVVSGQLMTTWDIIQKAVQRQSGVTVIC
jgi:hypothetical protein